VSTPTQSPTPSTPTKTRLTEARATVIAAVIPAVIGAAVALGPAFFAGKKQGEDSVPDATRTVTVATTATETVTTTASPTVGAAGNGGDPPPSGDTSTANGQAIHLAGESSLPAGVQLVDPSVSDVTNLAINGKVFDIGWTRYDSNGSAPFDLIGISLNRSYSTFKATIGLSSNSPEGAAKVELIADGRVVWSQTVSLQKSYSLALPVKNVQRLTMRGYSPKVYQVLLAVGDPTILP